MSDRKDPTFQNREREGGAIDNRQSTIEIPHSEFRIPNSKKYLFDSPRNVKRLLRIFYLSLAVLLGTDFFLPKHPHFPWEEWPSFSAVYGFVACVVLVIVAKYILRPLVMRREDYYD